MKLRHIYEKKLGQEDEPPETHVESSFHYEEHPDNVPGFDDAAMRVVFRRFGRGEKPRNYEVEIDWLDVKHLIREFIEIEHPHAEHLQRILKMARSLDDQGWQSDLEPSEFWEGLLND
ncbi:hypothetical protein [Bradyrhizobium sp. HKCCYLR20261]|uniref:hypothetical protein n=1 Tax=Bradyrhizobium sp. HKCCYLR20261 TaxID=3420760 RepID=UPI003EB6F9A6